MQAHAVDTTDRATTVIECVFTDLILEEAGHEAWQQAIQQCLNDGMDKYQVAMCIKSSLEDFGGFQPGLALLHAVIKD